MRTIDKLNQQDRETAATAKIEVTAAIVREITTRPGQTQAELWDALKGTPFTQRQTSIGFMYKVSALAGNGFIACKIINGERRYYPPEAD